MSGAINTQTYVSKSLGLKLDLGRPGPEPEDVFGPFGRETFEVEASGIGDECSTIDNGKGFGNTAFLEDTATTISGLDCSSSEDSDVRSDRPSIPIWLISRSADASFDVASVGGNPDSSGCARDGDLREREVAVLVVVAFLDLCPFPDLSFFRGRWFSAEDSACSATGPLVCESESDCSDMIFEALWAASRRGVVVDVSRSAIVYVEYRVCMWIPRVSLVKYKLTCMRRGVAVSGRISGRQSRFHASWMITVLVTGSCLGNLPILVILFLFSLPVSTKMF